jgi:hypothetical protein
MTDRDLYIAIRRAVMMILAALDKKYGVGVENRDIMPTT